MDTPIAVVYKATWEDEKKNSKRYIRRYSSKG